MQSFWHGTRMGRRKKWNWNCCSISLWRNGKRTWSSYKNNKLKETQETELSTSWTIWQIDYKKIFIGGDAEKKSFIRSLMCIFALLWNTKVDSVDKIKRTATRWPRTSRVLPWLMKKRWQRKVKRPFKIKVTLPEQKVCRH